jgi:hypothetical protein
VRKRIFEMVKAVGAASRSEILGGSQGAQTPARFQLIRARQQQGCGYAKNWNPAGYWRSLATASLVDLFSSATPIPNYE